MPWGSARHSSTSLQSHLVGVRFKVGVRVVVRFRIRVNFQVGLGLSHTIYWCSSGRSRAATGSSSARSWACLGRVRVRVRVSIRVGVRVGVRDRTRVRVRVRVSIRVGVRVGVRVRTRVRVRVQMTVRVRVPGFGHAQAALRLGNLHDVGRQWVELAHP